MSWDFFCWDLTLFYIKNVLGLFLLGLDGQECWGRWPSEASPTSGQADDFSSRAVSVTRRDLRIMGLTETLMPLMSREFCCAGMVLRGGAGLRCRRHRWLHFGDEGSRGQKHCAPAGDIASGASSSTGEMSEKARRDRSRILGCFGTEGAALLDTWLPPTCKEGTARGGDKGCRV
jgi:hypothetical protein